MTASIDMESALREIVAQSGMDEIDVRARIEKKIAQFNGLLTEHGATVLVANELRVKISSLQADHTLLKLGELKAGMANVDTQGNVTMVDRMKPFTRNGKEGKYIHVRLKDQTGEALITFWNDQADEALQKGLRPGSQLKLTNCRVGLFQETLQLNMGYNGGFTVTNEGGDNISAPDKITPFAHIQENRSVHGEAHIIDVLPGKGYYVKCGGCGGKLPEIMTACVHCQSEKIDARLLLPLLLDDGSASLRGVAFEEQALQTYGKTKEEVLAALQSDEGKRELHRNLLGKRLRIRGRSKIGMGGEVELIIQDAKVIPFETNEEINKA
ncbi:MAG: DUF2240 family protein [Candidatus Diapherotrites archaeon]|nr:DUF2240 family protein [Candidatus Diapherotrites archaeon]MDZ4256338.1 DUF2240 family protein [archaeon]